MARRRQVFLRKQNIHLDTGSLRRVDKAWYVMAVRLRQAERVERVTVFGCTMNGSVVGFNVEKSKQNT